MWRLTSKMQVGRWGPAFLDAEEVGGQILQRPPTKPDSFSLVAPRAARFNPAEESGESIPQVGDGINLRCQQDPKR
jgi:hypothetical protein